jgi:hypothetical protein
MRSTSVPCGHELHVDLARHHLGLGLGVQPDVRGDHAGDRAGRDQLADAVARLGGVVGHEGEAPRAAGDDRVDHPVRRADPHEAADEHVSRRPVGDHRRRFFGPER